MANLCFVFTGDGGNLSGTEVVQDFFLLMCVTDDDWGSRWAPCGDLVGIDGRLDSGTDAGANKGQLS